MTSLDSLALSRGTVDRLTEKRSDPEWLDAVVDALTVLTVLNGYGALFTDLALQILGVELGIR